MGKSITILAIFLSIIGFAQEMNISYGEHPQQEFDIYFPDEVNEDTKIVIFIHGGGWQAEHRQRDYWGYRNYVEKMYEDAGDMILINMDYRLVIPNGSTYVFPDQIDDITNVINKVKSDYNLANNKVILTGNSAGGHLSLLYYLRQETPIEKIIPICAPYDGNVQVGGTTYFQAALYDWLQAQFINPDDYDGITLEEIFNIVNPATYANPDLDDIFYVHMTGDPLHQLEAIQEDYPNIRYQVYDTSHSGWIHNPIRQDLINQSIEFIREQTDEVVEEECTVPTNVTLTRISHTMAKFEGANPNFNYQGSANRAGRPLRPYPMYGMDNMTVPHVQDRLVPAFDYDVWLRTICGDGTYSDWSEAFYLPRFEGPRVSSNYYNINGVFMGNSYEQLPRGYYIKNNGQTSTKIYKK